MKLTRPLSSLSRTEVEDYEKLVVAVEFKPGQDTATVTVTILDDTAQPIREGNETFRLVLENPDQVVISNPEKVLIRITDEADGMIQFRF